MFKYMHCIDANTAYCPCVLAETGECLICSHLKGEDFCDCVNYCGLCIYQEYLWNNERSNMIRQYNECKITSKSYLREDVLLLKIKVDKKLAIDLNNIGAYVFLKKPDCTDFNGAPISIFDSDINSNEITVAIKIIGVKTKLIQKCENSIMVKGPFWNGIQGQQFIKNLKSEKCVIIGRGIGLAPALLAAKKLVGNSNEIIAFLEKGRSQKNYLEDYFNALECTTQSLEIMDRHGSLCKNGMQMIADFIKANEVKAILSAGNDVFHRKILNYLYQNNNKLVFATVNNSAMCCGEGSCGSCMQEFKNRPKIKACKQQYNPLEYFFERKENE